jgi:pilus assembly protein CpaB
MFGVLGLLVVGYVAKNLLAVQEKKVVSPKRDIPMAITDISPGTVITDRHLGMGKIDVSQLTAEMLLTNRVIVGRVARTPLKAAHPIKANQLYQPGELPPLELSPGMRAVSILVGDSASMVDGMVKPGDHVDVLFTVAQADAAMQGGVTMRLFEGVKILAVNRSLTQSSIDRGGNLVTLELTETQSNIIVLAKDKGKLTLTYNPNGKGSGGLALSNAERITLYDILGLVPPGKPKEPTLTEIFRGTARSTTYYDDRGRFIGNRVGAYQTTNDRQQLVLPAPALPPAVLGPAPGTQPDQNVNPAPNPGTPAPSTTTPPQDNQDQPRPVPTAALPQDQPN